MKCLLGLNPSTDGFDLELALQGSKAALGDAQPSPCRENALDQGRLFALKLVDFHGSTSSEQPQADEEHA